MDLLLLRSTSHVSIYYDQANDWLFVEWQGHTDLPAVERACLELAQVLLQRPYRRMLTSHAHVASTSWDVPAWLAQAFLPYLALAGVEQVAWVSGRSARAHDVVHDIVSRQPTLPIILFDDLESAVGWLQRTGTTSFYQRSPSRLPATGSTFRQAVNDFTFLVLSQLNQRFQPI